MLCKTMAMAVKSEMPTDFSWPKIENDDDLEMKMSGTRILPFDVQPPSYT